MGTIDNRILIVGRFSKEGGYWRFSNHRSIDAQGQPIYPLNAVEFFDKVRPCLVEDGKSVVQVGQVQYRGFKYKVPEKNPVANDRYVPLVMHDALLDNCSNSEKGEFYYKKLREHLQTMAELTWDTQEKANKWLHDEWANQVGGARPGTKVLNAATLQALLKSTRGRETTYDPSFSRLLTSYLLCMNEDENSVWSHCERILSQNDEIQGDTSILKMLKTSLDQAKDLNRINNIIGGDIQRYLTAYHWVSRFARTRAYHTFIVKHLFDIYQNGPARSAQVERLWKYGNGSGTRLRKLGEPQLKEMRTASDEVSATFTRSSDIAQMAHADADNEIKALMKFPRVYSNHDMQLRLIQIFGNLLTRTSKEYQALRANWKALAEELNFGIDEIKNQVTTGGDYKEDREILASNISYDKMPGVAQTCMRNVFNNRIHLPAGELLKAYAREFSKAIHTRVEQDLQRNQSTLDSIRNQSRMHYALIRGEQAAYQNQYNEAIFAPMSIPDLTIEGIRLGQEHWRTNSPGEEVKPVEKQAEVVRSHASHDVGRDASPSDKNMKPLNKQEDAARPHANHDVGHNASPNDNNTTPEKESVQRPPQVDVDTIAEIKLAPTPAADSDQMIMTLVQLTVESQSIQSMVTALSPHIEGNAKTRPNELRRTITDMLATSKNLSAEQKKVFDGEYMALLLGETILSVPSRHEILGVEDLSHFAGLTLEMLVAWGDCDLTSVKEDELGKLDLSRFYPYLDESTAIGATGYSSLITNVGHLCDTVNATSAYLEEVAQIRDLFESARNSTVMEIHVLDIADKGASDKFDSIITQNINDSACGFMIPSVGFHDNEIKFSLYTYKHHVREYERTEKLCVNIPLVFPREDNPDRYGPLPTLSWNRYQRIYEHFSDYKEKTDYSDSWSKLGAFRPLIERMLKSGNKALLSYLFAASLADKQWGQLKQSQPRGRSLIEGADSLGHYLHLYLQDSKKIQNQRVELFCPEIIGQKLVNHALTQGGDPRSSTSFFKILMGSLDTLFNIMGPSWKEEYTKIRAIKYNNKAHTLLGANPALAPQNPPLSVQVEVDNVWFEISLKWIENAFPPVV